MRESTTLTSENVDKEMLEAIERCERMQKEMEAAKAAREARIYAEDIEVIYEYGGKRKHLVSYVERDITNPEYKQRTSEFFRNRKEMERYVKELKEKAERMKRIAQEKEDEKENSVEEENVVESNCANEKGQENMENNSQEDTPCLEENNETKSNINLNKNVMKKQNLNVKGMSNQEIVDKLRENFNFEADCYEQSLLTAEEKDELFNEMKMRVFKNYRRNSGKSLNDFMSMMATCNIVYGDNTKVCERVLDAMGFSIECYDIKIKALLESIKAKANVAKAGLDVTDILEKEKSPKTGNNEVIELGTLNYNGFCDARMMFNPENCTMSMVDERDNVFFSITDFPQYRALLMMEGDEMTSEMVGKYIYMYDATSAKYGYQQHEWYDDINELYDYMINYLSRECEGFFAA